MPANLDGKTSDADKRQAIVDQHFQGSKEMETYNLHLMKGIQEDRGALVARILKALSPTSDTSTPGPDRISYHLLKLIKDTNLGT